MKVTLDNTIGAAFLGLSVSCILFGIAVVQTHLYFMNFPKDWTFQKISVGTLMILATLNMIFTVHAVYYYLIVSFGNAVGLDHIVWSFKLQALMNVLMIVFVQGLYALRVWKLGNYFSQIGPAIAGFVVSCGWAIGFLLVGKLYGKTSFATLDSISPYIYATFAAATTIDVVIASSLCYYLKQSRSSFSITNNKILIVMRYVVTTGCLTSACSLSALITYATMPHNMVFIGIDFLLPILYFNSYMAMLNARKSMNELETSSVDITNRLKMRSGFTLRTESENQFSVDDKTSPDGIPSSAKRFTSNSSPKWDPEPDKDFRIVIHGAEEQH